MATILGDVLYIPKSWDIYQSLVGPSEFMVVLNDDFTMDFMVIYPRENVYKDVENTLGGNPEMI